MCLINLYAVSIRFVHHGTGSKHKGMLVCTPPTIGCDIILRTMVRSRGTSTGGVGGRFGLGTRREEGG